MKKFIALMLQAALLCSLTGTTWADGADSVSKIEIVTKQGDGVFQPQQVAVERSLSTGGLHAERLRMTPLPSTSTDGIAQVNGSSDVYVCDRGDGSIWEMNVDTGQVVRHFAPSQKVSNNIQGIATGLGDDIYVYYNGAGKIQRLHRDGTVAETFAAPTVYGHSLVYKDGSLYLMDDRGTVYQIDAYSKSLLKKITLLGPDGSSFAPNHTFSLFWDGRYFNIANAQDGYKLYRYTSDWNYNDQVDLQQWSMMGCLFDGREYLALNVDNDRIFTIRVTDDSSGEVGVPESQHYQYVGNVLTTSTASLAFPSYEDKNIDLLYNDLGQVTPDFVKPYVAYLNRNGQMTGTMFDTFVFLPSMVGAKKMFYQKTDPSDWADYVQKTMNDMRVLDKAWGERNQTLGLTDRANVYLAVPYPNPSDDLATREAALHAYMDQAKSLFYQQQFQNLYFRGFYWYNEDANYADPLVVDFNRYVHSKGLVSLWIPYEVAQETNDYSVLGFDEVFQQPNYFFKDQFAENLNRFFNLDWTGARYHKGVEMELDERALQTARDPEYRKLFLDYLHYGLVQGYLGGSSAWYENGTVHLLYQAHDPLYDTIHNVLNHTYSDSSVSLQTQEQGDLTSTYTTSIPANAKIRLDLITSQPYQVERVTLTTNAVQAPLRYTGTLRVDEELAVQDGMLVKQPIGQNSGGLRLGFNVPLDKPVQVTIQPSESVGTIGSTTFADVPDTMGTKPAILALSQQGIINGMVENGNLVFKPNGKLTRAQFAVLLTNAYQLQATGSPTFADSKNAWYSEAVAAVTEQGYMSGYDPAHFGPDDSVTQEQVAAILVRALHKHDVQASKRGVTILNQQRIDGWAQDTVLEGKALGLYGDQFGDALFDPVSDAVRGDVADVLYRALHH